MTQFRFIEIDGKRYLWQDIVELRRQQKVAHRKCEQAALFELRHDCRPASQRTSAQRFLEPSLFEERRPS